MEPLGERWQLRALWCLFLLYVFWSAPGVEWARQQYWLLSDRLRHLEALHEPPPRPVPDWMWAEASRSVADEMGSAYTNGRPRYMSERPWVIRGVQEALTLGSNTAPLAPGAAPIEVPVTVGRPGWLLN